MRKGSATSRTPQWKTAVHQTLRCANCGHVSDSDTLDTQMSCPECSHTEWTLEAANSGERVQVPGSDSRSEGKV